jgi:aminopeptidase N
MLHDIEPEALRMNGRVHSPLGKLLALLLVVIFFPAALLGQQAAEEPFRSSGDRPIDIQHIRLELQVDLPKKTVLGQAFIKLRSLRPIHAISLDAAEFEVRSVALSNGSPETQPIRFHHDGNKLTVDLDPAWPAGREGTLRVDYRIRDPKAGLHFFAPSPSDPKVALSVWSQGESTTNSHWFPCLDQPNQRQTTEILATVADGFEVLSNGKLVDRRTNPDKTVTFHWLQDKPHPAYLVTLVVGQFDVVREDWEGMPVLFYVPKGKSGDVARSMGRTRDMLTFFSQRFGIRYPWDKYAQVVAEQFGGGMENTSATTMGDILLDERARLDQTSDWIVSHEMAHQWWGDLVTCRDWAHIWLNEGFASYAEALWAEHDLGPDEYAYNMVEKSGGAIGGGQKRPIVDRRYPNPDSMFDGRAYPKGAWVLHMLRQRLGDDVFFRCLQRYGTEYRLQSADTTDFRKCLEAETGRTLERFFYDWTERPGNPVLTVKAEYLPETKLARVSVKQTQAGEAFHFPLTIAFHCPPASQPVVLEQEITEKDQVAYFPLPERPTYLEVDPQQAVLAEINEDQGRDSWMAQLTEAPNVAVRIRAAAHFGKSKEPADRDALAKALPAEKFWGVRTHIAQALGESGGDICRDALIQGLQHPHAKTRRACADALGKFRHDTKAAEALKTVLKKGDPSYNVEAAALTAYVATQPADAVAVALPWLSKPSLHDLYPRTALNSLGEAQDLSLLDTIIDWTKRGKPRNCRSAALTALGRLAKAAPTDSQRDQIVKAVVACLDGEGPQVRGAAAETLRELGQSATPALPALEALSRHDPEERVREQARRAVEQIRSHTPVPVEVTRLREELERLKKTHEDLRDRLQKFEKKP